MSLHQAKPAFQALLRPLVGWLAGKGVTANQVTLAAVVLSVGLGAGIMLTGGAALLLLAVPAVLLVRMALNAIDGMLAREHGQASRAGFFLNEIGDVVADAGLYLPIFLVLAPGFALVASAAVMSLAIAEFSGVLAAVAGGVRRYDGPFGKSDRAVFFSLLAVFSVIPGLPQGFVVIAMIAAIVLAAITAANRARAVRPLEPSHV